MDSYGGRGGGGAGVLCYSLNFSQLHYLITCYCRFQLLLFYHTASMVKGGAHASRPPQAPKLVDLIAVLGVITLRIMHGIPISEQTRNDRICTGFAFVFLSMNTLSFIYHLCV